ncbi:TPA: TRAM domain-containing protein [Candidatus Woesearchaeota archaeon]|nr:TRAM domain-containing protein [Candidatus Woesearchaeota archaeon]HIH39388.1 TRAM domain-containing protein [Candidatus Woesearchaeota archaeon]
MYREDREDRGGFRPRRDSGFGGRSNFVPVNVGDEIDVKIEAVGEKGDGVAKVKGFVLFVPGVKEGDLVRVRVTKVLRKVGFAESIGPAQGPIPVDTKPPKKEEKKEEEQFAGDDSEEFGEEGSFEEEG